MIWLWFSLAIVTLIFELSTGVFYFLMLSIAMFITGFYSYFFTPSLELAIVVASLLSIIGVLTIALINRNKKKQQNPLADLDIGHRVVVKKHLANQKYHVYHRGALWEAVLEDSRKAVSVGDTVVIVGKHGNTLIINNN